MRRFIVGLFAGIGILTVLVAALIAIAAWRLAAHRSALPGTIVLSADLNRGLAEGPSQDVLSEIAFGSKPTLRDFLDALERAGNDARVKGIFVTLGDDHLALAACQEVRDAVAAFRAKGKFAIAFATSFGEFGPGTRPYYLATAFDEIWLQPVGSVGLIGLQIETPFLRGTLDKLGIEPSFAQREQYKTAMNMLTEAAMTPPQREETEDLLGSDEGQIVAGIANARNLPATRVSGLIDRGPFVAGEAQSAKLIDRIGYVDEASARARRRGGPGARFVSLKNYLNAVGHPHDSGRPKIALIYGTGLITEGDGASNPLLGRQELGARHRARAFREAAGDRDVRAILFRIDSPGGSAVASETIWREVARARRRGKPIIVSMGDVAASGGYYIAAPADKIVAEPATLTGSIGVLAGKLVIAGLLKKLGVTEDSVRRGANAAMFSGLEDFSPAAHDRLDRFLDATYAAFKQRVAAGRHLTLEQVEAVAKGRVWTGAEAKEKGLVDRLGGYDLALRLAVQAAKIPAGQPFTIAVFPRPKSTFARIYDRLAGRDSEEDGSAGIAAAARAMAGFARLLADAETLTGDRGTLHMPPLGEIR